MMGRTDASASSGVVAPGRAAVIRSMRLLCCCLSLALATPGVFVVPLRAGDLRLRTVLYSPDEIYRLPARVGYEIDLQFEAGETFRGLGSGDVEGLAFKAESNHLFIKPKAARVRTNLTVLTDRRIYHFDYVTLPQQEVDLIDTVYALRFLYAEKRAAAPVAPVHRPTGAEALLSEPSPESVRNRDYWYCGAPQLRPLSAWDDGVHTHLEFSARAELPAVFVANEDGTEALVNFNVLNDTLILHRVAHRFILRRGKLVGCVVNKSYVGGGRALPLGTTSPLVERKTRQDPHAPLP